jgi:hypothetical protein
MLYQSFVEGDFLHGTIASCCNTSEKVILQLDGVLLYNV